jgi:hypothetical protein
MNVITPWLTLEFRFTHIWSKRWSYRVHISQTCVILHCPCFHGLLTLLNLLKFFVPMIVSTSPYNLWSPCWVHTLIIVNAYKSDMCHLTLTSFALSTVCSIYVHLSWSCSPNVLYYWKMSHFLRSVSLVFLKKSLLIPNQLISKDNWLALLNHLWDLF